MFINRIYLYGYKPLLHQPITELDASFTSTLQLLIGQNGSGKSSLLTELSPFPPVSSIFEKDGVKKLHISHGKSNYVLTSDFSDKSHPHSFKRDEEELNESGNSKVQQELVETEFGYTKSVAGVLNMTSSLTKLSKASRKSLLFELYPGDLTFILDKHKFICSSIKKYRNNLEMLQSMKRETTEQQLTREQMQEYESSLEQLKNELNAVDKTIFLLEKELNQIRNRENYECDEENKLDLKQMCEDLKQISSRAAELKIRYPHLFRDQDVRLTKDKIDNRMETLQSDLKKYEEQAENLKKIINEYSSFSESSVSDEIKKLEKSEKDLLTRHEKHKVDPQIPVIPEDDIESVKTDVREWTESLLSRIGEMTSQVWSREKLEKCENLIKEIHSQIRDFENEKKHLNDEYNKKNEEYQSRINLSPPAQCNFDCRLKESYQKFLKDVKKRVDEVAVRINKVDKRIETLNKRLEKLRNVYQGPSQVIQSVEQLSDLIDWRKWRSYLCGQQSVIQILNENGYILCNRMDRIIRNSENKKAQLNIEKELNTVRDKLETLRNTNLPAEELINKTAMDRKSELNSAVKQIEQIKFDLNRLQELGEAGKTLLQDTEFLEQMQEKFKVYGEYVVLRRLEQVDMETIDSLKTVRDNLNESIRSKENQIKEQKELQSKLEKTIEPRIKKTQEELRKVRLIEPELSPTAGIPHRYMVKFLNKVLAHVNEIIRSVWGYSLEMEYMDENIALDYAFPVRINDGNKIQDCSMCSQGEKEILDMAWLFAVYRVLGYNRKFPVFLDEPDSALSHGNRQRIMELIGNLINSGDVYQVFMINHYHSLFSAFENNEILCLNPSNIITPEQYNTHANIS